MVNKQHISSFLYNTKLWKNEQSFIAVIKMSGFLSTVRLNNQRILQLSCRLWAFTKLRRSKLVRPVPKDGFKRVMVRWVLCESKSFHLSLNQSVESNIFIIFVSFPNACSELKEHKQNKCEPEQRRPNNKPSDPKWSKSTKNIQTWTTQGCPKLQYLSST